MTYESQIRATFKDTKKHQEELRVYLDKLELTNQFVPYEERESFFSLLSDALLGFDYDKKLKLRLPDGTFLHINNLGEFIRRIAYYESPKVDYDFFKYYNKDSRDVDIKHIWHELKFFIFGIYPEAVGMSIRISKEQAEYYDSGDSDAVGWKEALKT